MHPRLDRRRVAVLAATLSTSLGVAPAPASGAISLELVASGLEQPVHATHAGDGSGRLFIVERAGRVRILKQGALLPAPFVDISLLVGSAGLEQGLLSMAFHPSFAVPGGPGAGQVFLSYTDLLGRNTVARYRVGADDPDRLDETSAEIIFTQTQPFPNHNGGLILFGPDGYLYMGIGDGGAADDPLHSGQSTLTLLGKMIRIDVDVPVGYGIPPDNPFADPADGVPGEIWALGLRNPWRFAFDPDGNLYIADVGQNSWEEVDFQPAAHGGRNYGWNVYEGNHAHRPQLFPPVTPYVFPVAEYPHAGGACSITGGPVYRGSGVTALAGAFLFGDYCNGKIWSLTQPESGTWSVGELADSDLQISSFGEDEDGEAYVLHLGLGLEGPGAIYRIVAPA